MATEKKKEKPTPLVKNLTGKGVDLPAGWRVLPKSSTCIHEDGRRMEGCPPDVAYQERTKRLADQGLISVFGYTPMKTKAKVKTKGVAGEKGQKSTGSEKESGEARTGAGSGKRKAGK